MLSTRVDALVSRFEQANQDVIEMVASASDSELSAICPAEGWTAAALGAHVGLGYPRILRDFIRPIVAGRQKLEPIDEDVVDQTNAREAVQNANMPKDRVLALLRDNGAQTAAYLRSLTDADLDRTTEMKSLGDNPVTVESAIESVLIGHPIEHGRSLRAGLNLECARAMQ